MVGERLKERGVRDKIENATEKIPSGPLGNAGQGDLIGAAGFFAVESTKPVWEFIPGVKQPGYKITGHGTRRAADGEEHILDIAAVSEDVAEWAAKYAAAPSNATFLAASKEIVNVQRITERRGYTTFRVTVLLSDPGEVNE